MTALTNDREATVSSTSAAGRGLLLVIGTFERKERKLWEMSADWRSKIWIGTPAAAAR